MDIKAVLESYYERFPQDLGKYETLDKQIERNEDLISRKNFNGHVTASGLVICPKGKRALMIFHKGLEMLIQPGGHLEEVDKSLLEASMREVKEETGLAEFNLLGLFESDITPLLIDTHEIPANMKKGEGKHYHHDFMYIFQASSEEIVLQLEEVSDAKWVDLNDLMELEDAVGKAVRRYLKLSV